MFRNFYLEIACLGFAENKMRGVLIITLLGIVLTMWVEKPELFPAMVLAVMYACLIGKRLMTELQKP